VARHQLLIPTAVLMMILRMSAAAVLHFTTLSVSNEHVYSPNKAVRQTKGQMYTIAQHNKTKKQQSDGDIVLKVKHFW